MSTELSEAEQVAALVELQGLLLGTESLNRFLHELAVMAVRTIEPERMSCGITLDLGGQPSTVASSDETAMRVDELQYGRGSGPCLSALRAGERTHIPDMTVATGWGEFHSLALAQGVRSSLSLPLIAQDTSMGAMNLYAPTSGAFGESEQARASWLAARAAGAVALAVRSSAQTALTEDLKAALASRTTIAQAQGILMAWHRCSPEDALARLRSASNDRNVKLRDVAGEIVADLSEQPRGDAEFTPRR